MARVTHHQTPAMSYLPQSFISPSDKADIIIKVNNLIGTLGPAKQNVTRVSMPVQAQLVAKVSAFFAQMLGKAHEASEFVQIKASDLKAWVNTPDRLGITPLQKAQLASKVVVCLAITVVIWGAALSLCAFIVKKELQLIKKLYDKLAKQSSLKKRYVKRGEKQTAISKAKLTSTIHRLAKQREQRVQRVQRVLKRLRMQRLTATTKSKI